MVPLEVAPCGETFSKCFPQEIDNFWWDFQVAQAQALFPKAMVRWLHWVNIILIPTPHSFIRYLIWDYGYLQDLLNITSLERMIEYFTEALHSEIGLSSFIGDGLSHFRMRVMFVQLKPCLPHLKYTVWYHSPLYHNQHYELQKAPENNTSQPHSFLRCRDFLSFLIS